MRMHASFVAALCCTTVFLFAPHADAATPDISSLQYRGIGPAIAGGRTTAVVGSDRDPLLYFAGGAGGGVFKTTDGGSTWKPLFDEQPVAPIGAIAVDPRDDRDVWVGTGESNPRNDVERGDGVWHSKDGGAHWEHAGLDDGGSIASISIDPRDPRKLAVAVLGQIFRDDPMRGIYTTTDGGAHWTRSLYVGPDTGASDVVRSPDHPDTLFAGMYEFRRMPWTMISGGEGGGVFRSDDDGATWRRISGRGLPSAPLGRIGLSVGHGGRVYAIIQSKVGDLWRSDDFGASWKLMPHSALVGDRSFYFSRIFVDPADSNRLISVGLILAMSTDGGRTFKKIATNDGWDYHQVWWSQDGRRLGIGSDEGALFSTDGGTTWRQPYDLPFAQAYHVGFDDAQPNYHVCIGLQDDSSWCGPSNGDSGLGVLNRDWVTVGTGDGMWAEYDPLDPHLIWSTTTSSDTGQVYVWDTRTQQAYEVSPDAEQNGGRPASMLKHRFNWDTPISFTSDGKALVGGEVVFESADQGQHWTVISPDLTRDEKTHQSIPGGPVSADMSGAEISDTLLDVAPSHIAPNVIWTGSDDGMVHVSRDGGTDWSDATPPDAPHWGRVSTVEPGRFSASTAFAAVDDHMLGDDRPWIYATTDFGKTWRSIGADLPADVYVRSIRQDVKNPSLLYAGTSRGVFASWDSGMHWSSLRLNMPATAIYDIEIQPRADDLVVASHGRGVWVLDDLHALQSLATASGVTLFPMRTTTRWYQWTPINSFSSDTLPSDEFAGPNVPYGALITYSLPSGSAKSVSIAIVDARGRVVRHLSSKDVPHKAGVNRTSWDLQEDGPTKWLGTFAQNQGPDEGAEVVPATFSVRLTVDGVTKQQPVTVIEDPRDSLTLAQMQARHDTLATLFAQLGRVDEMLNHIDKALAGGGGATRPALLAFKSKLTFSPRNVEDLGGPGGVRDEIVDLIGRLASPPNGSFQPPNQAELDQQSAIKAEFDAAQATAAQLGL